MSTEDLLVSARVKGLRLAVAESCTGGLLAGELTTPAGASTVFDRGFVTCSNAAKVELLGVTLEALTIHGAVSEEVAAQMALGALKRSEADLAVSVTGVAGPGASGRKPEGRVCFGLANAEGAHTETVEFGPRGRDEVRQASVAHALDLLRQAVERAP